MHNIIIKHERIYRMKNLDCIQQINSLSNPNSHIFAAANTHTGFVSYFDSIFASSGLDRIYILKGGPGVGKSTLMKKAGKKALDEGFSPVFCHCSSDPKSLDGVIIPEKGCAILDGTAPHVFDPVYAGSRDIVVNLGEAWNTDYLYQKREVIKSLSDNKAACYKSAYRLLAAAKKAEDELSSTGLRCMNVKKASLAAERLAAKLFNKKGGGKASVTVCNALSCYGEVRFFTYEKMAETLYFIKDVKHTASGFFDKLYNLAKMSGAEVVAGVRPLAPEQICLLYFPAVKLCISLYDDVFCQELDKAGKMYKIINLARFLDSEKYKTYRGKYKFTEKCCLSLLESACGELERAGCFHAELEKIYGKATDYEVVSQMGDKVIKDIFG